MTGDRLCINGTTGDQETSEVADSLDAAKEKKVKWLQHVK